MIKDFYGGLVKETGLLSCKVCNWPPYQSFSIYFIEDLFNCQLTSISTFPSSFLVSIPFAEKIVIYA